MVAPKQSVFLFIGEDRYLKEEALKRLIPSLTGVSADGQDIKTFYGSELDHQEVFDSLNTIPLLSEKRLVVIRDIEKISDDMRSGLIDYIKKPSKSAYLVLDAQSESAIKDYAEISGHISMRRFGAAAGDSLESWIRNYLKSSGKAIDDEAMDILKELEGNNMSNLSMELDKLIAFSGNSKTISAKDTEQVVGISLIRSAFDMTGEIGRNNVSGALKIASDLMRSGSKEYELVGLLSWYFKRMLRARIMKDSLQNDHMIGAALNIGRRFQGDFFRQLAGFGQERINACIETLFQADIDIKRSRLPSGSVLEMAIISLCLL